MPLAAPAPAAAAPDAPATPDAARGAAHPTRAFNAALANLGMQAAPAVSDVAVTVAAATSQACAAAIPVGVMTPPATVSALARRSASHHNGAVGDPPQARGPPAPLDSPHSPAATTSTSAAAAGGPSGAHHCAIDLVDIAVEPFGGDAVVTPRHRDPAAPSAANVAARAPPVV